MHDTVSTPTLTFDQFEYKRPDMEAFRNEFEASLQAFDQSPNPESQIQHFDTIIGLREGFASMYNLCYIRHTSNTADAFYESENDFFDQILPTYEDYNNRFVKAILASPFREQLEERFGKHFFVLNELSLKTFESRILEDLQQENSLSTGYTKIKAQAQVEFDGKKYNLSSIMPLEINEDRDLRRRASAAKWSFFEEKAPEVEGLFDNMVKTRHQLAQKLGFKNFVEVGYARMRRSDYTPEMVAQFRKHIREQIVPLAGELYERQRQRLGYDTLYFYDEEFKFNGGNPRPIGTPEEIVEKARKMYGELSPETDAFFRFMQDTRLMDLVNRDNKAPGGYCTFIGKYEAPFIYSNFNGTSGDIDVLTHEAGHAFQVYSSRHFPFEEYHWPTSDAAEIHSMSMEFFTWPWMEMFFGDKTDKYKFMHLGGALQFLPYGVAVDEFQHIVYENPDMTPAERNQEWRKLEKIYLPHRNYDGNSFLEGGGFWQKQSHIFNSPFYYIDYTLAQICAFQFWVRDRNDHQSAWADYLRLCQAGGSKSFLGLVELANLHSPFDPTAIESVISDIRSFFSEVDDSKF